MVEALEGAGGAAVLLGGVSMLERSGKLREVSEMRVALPNGVGMLLTAASVCLYCLFALLASVDIGLAGSVANEVGVQPAHPWLFAFYNLTLNLVNAAGISVAYFYSPNGVMSFEIFLGAALALFLSRANLGLSRALGDAVLAAGSVLTAFTLTVWWASPYTLSIKAAQFTGKWAVDGTPVVSNAFVLVVSTSILAYVIVKWKRRTASPPEAASSSQAPVPTGRIPESERPVSATEIAMPNP